MREKGDNMNELAIELVKTLKDTKEFVAAQAPSVVQELLRREYVSLCMGIGLGVILLVASIVFYKLSVKYKEEDFFPLFAILCGVFCIFTPMILGCNIAELVNLKVAPKVFLLEHLGRYIK